MLEGVPLSHRRMLGGFSKVIKVSLELKSWEWPISQKGLCLSLTAPLISPHHSMPHVYAAYWEWYPGIKEELYPDLQNTHIQHIQQTHL